MSSTAAAIEHVTLGGVEQNALTKSRSSSGEPAGAVSTFFRSSLRFLRSTCSPLWLGRLNQNTLAKRRINEIPSATRISGFVKPFKGQVHRDVLFEESARRHFSE